MELLRSKPYKWPQKVRWWTGGYFIPDEWELWAPVFLTAGDFGTILFFPDGNRDTLACGEIAEIRSWPVACKKHEFVHEL